VRSGTVPAAVGLAAVLLAGCGGSSERFADRANRVCADANERVASLGAEPQILTAEQADWLEHLTSIDRSAVAKLRELEPPEDEQRAVSAMLSAFERGLARGDVIARASRAGDFTAFRRRVDAAIADLGRGQLLARRHGLDECARLGRVDR
jgi:hypothetical protein